MHAINDRQIFCSLVYGARAGACRRGLIVIIAAERVATFSYFIPGMVRLQRSELPVADIEQAMARWANLNHLRLAATFVAWFAALKALVAGGG